MRVRWSGVSGRPASSAVLSKAPFQFSRPRPLQTGPARCMCQGSPFGLGRPAATGLRSRIAKASSSLAKALATHTASTSGRLLSASWPLGLRLMASSQGDADLASSPSAGAGWSKSRCGLRGHEHGYIPNMIGSRLLRPSRIARRAIRLGMLALGIVLGLSHSLAGVTGRHCRVHETAATHGRHATGLHARYHMHGPGTTDGLLAEIGAMELNAPRTPAIHAGHECPHCPARSCPTEAPCAATMSSLALIAEVSPLLPPPVYPVAPMAFTFAARSTTHQPPTPPPQVA